MPEVKPDKEIEIDLEGTGEQAPVELKAPVDPELTDALEKVGKATSGVGLTRTMDAKVANGVVDMGEVDPNAVDTDEAIARFNEELDV